MLTLSLLALAGLIGCGRWLVGAHTNERASPLVRSVRSLLGVTPVLLRRSDGHERAAKGESTEAAKPRQEQLEKEVREYHERDGRQMGSGGKQPLDQLLASGAAHQR